MIIINGKFLSQPLTGVQRFAIEIIKELILIRDDIFVVAPDSDKIIKPAINLPLIHTGKHIGLIWEQKELPAWLKKQKSPLLINLCNSGPLLYEPTISTIHDLATFINPAWFSKIFAFSYQKMLPILARRSEYILTVSQEVKKELIQELKLSPDKIKVIYNGLPKDFIAAAENQSAVKKKKQILAVGSFDPRKNLQLLMDAFTAIENKGDWMLIIAGRDAGIFNYQNLKLPENCKDRIQIKKDLNDKELINLYRESEVFVSLSAYEGFGLPVLEAIAFQCKVLVSDIPVYRELFSGFVNFTGLDTQLVKNELEKLMQSEEAKLSANHLLEKYSYRNAARYIDELINTISAVR